MRLVGCVAILILLSPSAWAMPLTGTNDFTTVIREFIYHSTESIVTSLIDKWNLWLYGEYNALLEQDLSSINPEPVELELEDTYLNQGSREALQHLANAQQAMLNAKQKQAECRQLKDHVEECRFLCTPEYHVKLCSRDFFEELNRAATELNQSLTKSLSQLSTDYSTYLHYGIDATHSTPLDGCYLYTLDIYNELNKYKQQKTIQHIRGEERPGEKIVLAISSSSKDFPHFFSKMAANENSLIPMILKKHKQCRKIEAELIEEYQNKTRQFSKQIIQLEDTYHPIKEQELCLLETQDLEAVQPSKPASLTRAIDFKRKEKLIGKDPKQSCQIIEANLKELKKLKTNALIDRSQKGYLVETLTNIQNTESIILQTHENLEDITTTTTGIRQQARTRANTLKREAKLITGLELEVLKQYLKDLEEAQDTMQDAEDKATEGRAAKTWASGIRKLEQILLLYSAQPEKDDLTTLLDTAETRLLLAGADSIDTTLEKARLTSAKQAIARNQYLLAKVHLTHILDSIEQKAIESYASLPETREKLKENLWLIKGAKKKTFLKYEKYYTPSLDYQAALGKLAEMEKDYHSLLSTAESALQDSSEELIKEHVKQRTKYLDTPIAGEPAQFLVEYSFTNPAGFTIPATPIAFKLEEPPIGAITKANMLSSDNIDPVTIAYLSNKLQFSTINIPEGEGFSLSLSYPLLPASLLSFSREITADTLNTNIKYKTSCSIKRPVERILIPLEGTIQTLSNSYPEDFQQTGGKQYLVIQYPEKKYERTFTVPSILLFERINTKTELKDNKAMISESIVVENQEDLKIDTAELSIQIDTKATKTKGLKYSDGKLFLKTSLSPYERKEFQVQYTIEDPLFYCRAFHHQIRTRIENAKFPVPDELFSELELAETACNAGGISEAIPALTSITSSLNSLETIAQGDKREKETFERLNQTAHKAISLIETTNKFTSLLGTKTTDISKEKDRLEKAEQLFSRGNLKSAISEIRPVTKLNTKTTELDKALEKKKSKINKQVQGLIEMKLSLTLFDPTSPELSEQIDQAATAQTDYELALLSKDKSRILQALLQYQHSYDIANKTLFKHTTENQNTLDILIKEKHDATSNLLSALQSANYSTHLSMHLPYSVTQWAKQQGISENYLGYEKARKRHIKNLTQAVSRLNDLEKKEPAEKLLFSKQLFDPIAIEQAKEFLKQADSEIGRKRTQARELLALAQEHTAKGILTNDAKKLLKKSEQYSSEERYLDSIAYTGFVIATETRPPSKAPRIAAALFFLLISAAIIYKKRDYLKKLLEDKQDDMELAERKLSFRRSIRE